MTPRDRAELERRKAERRRSEETETDGPKQVPTAEKTMTPAN